MLNEEFSEAHNLEPGDEFTAIINGRRRALTVVAVVLSPEFIYQTPPGMIFPDPKRFGVMWMGEAALASAYDMEGAFNDLDRKSTRLNSSHVAISYAVFCLKKKKKHPQARNRAGPSASQRRRAT